MEKERYLRHWSADEWVGHFEESCALLHINLAALSGLLADVKIVARDAGNTEVQQQLWGESGAFQN